jgi:hypothetical protein
MKSSFFLFPILGILFLSCNMENNGRSFVHLKKNQSVIPTDNTDTLVHLKKNQSVIPTDNTDTIPNTIYDKIVSLRFVQNRISQLEEKQVKISFYNEEEDSEYILIQVVAIDTIRMVPIFNFHYYPNTGLIFYYDTLADTLVLIN